MPGVAAAGKGSPATRPTAHRLCWPWQKKLSGSSATAAAPAACDAFRDCCRVFARHSASFIGKTTHNCARPWPRALAAFNSKLRSNLHSIVHRQGRSIRPSARCLLITTTEKGRRSTQTITRNVQPWLSPRRESGARRKIRNTRTFAKQNACKELKC